MKTVWLNLKTFGLFVGKFKIKISVRWGRPESGTNALSLMRVPYNDFAKYRLFGFDCHDYTSFLSRSYFECCFDYIPAMMLLWLHSNWVVGGLWASFKLGGWANYGWLVLSSLGQSQIDFNRFSTTSNRNVWSCLPSLIMCQRVVWPNVKTHQNVLQMVKVRRILKLDQNSGENLFDLLVWHLVMIVILCEMAKD